MKPVATVDEVRAVLVRFVSRMTAVSMMRSAADRTGLGAERLERLGANEGMLDELRAGVSLFVPVEQRAACLAQLAALTTARSEAAPPSAQEVAVRDDTGIVDARSRARALAAEVGFDAAHQTKIATVVSELARNMVRYAGGGTVRLLVFAAPLAGIGVVAHDEGPGIADVAAVLGGGYRSRTGLGKGLLGCKRIMDEFAVETTPRRGTTVTVRKYL